MSLSSCTGVTTPNNSLVDLDDVLYHAPNHQDFNEPPTNAQTHLHNGALLCVIDLVDCCDTPHTVHGDWYYPDGRTVPNDNIVTPIGGPAEFLINRGPNEVIKLMDGSFMAQFVSFVNGVVHQKEVVSTVSYPVLLILMLPKYSMQILVS